MPLLSAVPAGVGARFLRASLHERDSIVVRVSDALLPCRHFVVVEQVRCFYDVLWVVVRPLRHVICQVGF